MSENVQVVPTTQVKIKKKVFTDESYKITRNGKSYPTSFYTLELDSGYEFIINPADEKDYAVLNALATVVFIASPRKVKPKEK